MKSIALFLLFLALTLSAEILDRSGMLSSREQKQLNQICDAIHQNSGELIRVVLATDSDLNQKDATNKHFARELSRKTSREWILVLIAPDGEVQISMSNGMNTEILPDHVVTMSEGTESIFSTGESARAVEFLLLNIADIIAQKNRIELSQLLSGGEFSHPRSANEMPITFAITILIAAVTILTYRKMLGKTRKRLNKSSPLGESLTDGDINLFGTSFQRRKCK